MKLEKDFRKAGGEFREFALKDLFEITGTKSLDEGKLDFVENGINFVGRVKHGIKGKIEPQPFEPNEPNTITASVIGYYKYSTFQTQPYYCSQNINKLTPRFEINRHLAMYFMTHVQKFISRFDFQQAGYKLVELQNHKITLPLDSKGDIDFALMQTLIKAIEKLVVKDLVVWNEKKLRATKEAIDS